jgi:DNA-binding transcriptional regulator YbjK
MPNGTNNALQVLASAVTPVVLVSATAILISGVNSRHISIADRMRTLSSEYRDVRTTDDRRTIIEQQMWMFNKRIHQVSWAIRSLYAAAWCFVAEVLLISATLWRDSLVAATVPLFLVGILLMMVAIAMQLMELQEANRTLFLEMGELKQLSRTNRGESTRH